MNNCFVMICYNKFYMKNALFDNFRSSNKILSIVIQAGYDGNDIAEKDTLHALVSYVYVFFNTSNAFYCLYLHFSFNKYK